MGVLNAAQKMKGRDLLSSQAGREAAAITPQTESKSIACN